MNSTFVDLWMAFIRGIYFGKNSFDPRYVDSSCKCHPQGMRMVCQVCLCPRCFMCAHNLFFSFLKQMSVETTEKTNDCRLEGNLETNDSRTETNFKTLYYCGCGTK